MSWLADFWSTYGSQILPALGQHLILVGVALASGIIVAVPLGIILTRFPRWSSPIIAVVSIIQTIPSLVFFALLIPIIGIGLQPALLVLFLYSLLPILRNTYIGVRSVDPTLLDASRGQGMTSWEILYMVEPSCGHLSGELGYHRCIDWCRWFRQSHLLWNRQRGHQFVASRGHSYCIVSAHHRVCVWTSAASCHTTWSQGGGGDEE